MSTSAISDYAKNSQLVVGALVDTGGIIDKALKELENLHSAYSVSQRESFYQSGVGGPVPRAIEVRKFCLIIVNLN